MKNNRIVLCIILATFSIICITYMNMNYDKLARNTYVTKENHDILLKYLTDEQITYVVENNIDVTQMEDFISESNFQFELYKYYYDVKNVRNAKGYVVVSFVNAVHDLIEKEDLLEALKYYDYPTLRELIISHSHYNKNAQIVLNPDDITLHLSINNTIGRYEPTDLISLNRYSTIPLMDNSIRLRLEAADALDAMCSYLEENAGTNCGGYYIHTGYLDYDTLHDLYSNMLETSGPIVAFENYGYPSHNEHQLGLCVDMVYENEINENRISLESIGPLFGFICGTQRDDVIPHMNSIHHLRYVGKEYAIFCVKNESCCIE